MEEIQAENKARKEKEKSQTLDKKDTDAIRKTVVR